MFWSVMLLFAVIFVLAGEIYWDTPRPDKLRFYGDWQPDLRVPRASDVTTASYVLQTLLQTRRYNEVADVANWLLRQRSLRGSFRSPVVRQCLFEQSFVVISPIIYLTAMRG